MGQDDSNTMQETVQSAVQWFTVSALAVPLISFVIYNIGLNLRMVVLGILVLCCILAAFNALCPSPHHFISSGRSPPALIAEERQLKKKRWAEYKCLLVRSLDCVCIHTGFLVYGLTPPCRFCHASPRKRRCHWSVLCGRRDTFNRVR